MSLSECNHRPFQSTQHSGSRTFFIDEHEKRLHNLLLNKPGFPVASPPTLHTLGILLALSRAALPELHFAALPSALIENHSREEPCDQRSAVWV